MNTKEKIRLILCIIFITEKIIQDSNAEEIKKNKRNNIHITAEEHFSLNSGFKGRAASEYADIKLTVMDFRDLHDKKKKDKTVYSFYSPCFSAGRMKKAGLLKEMSCPSYWSAGSETYTDKSDYREDTSLKRNGNWVLKMNIYDYLFTYAELDENNDFHIKEKGGGFNLFPGTDFNVSAAVSESENEKLSDDNWYFSRDVQYGEKIYCSAVKCVFNLFSIKNSAAGGVSFGECMKTGRFVRYQPSLKTDQLSFYLLMSYSDRFYREPVSGYPSVRLKRGGKAEYELNKNIGIEAAYNIDTYHEDYLTEIENRNAERIFFKIIYDADSYYFFTEFQRKNEIDEDDAEFITEDIIGFTAGARGDNISCLINPEIKYCNKEAVSRNIILESGVKHGIKTLTLRVKRETGEQVKSVISAKLGFKDTHYLIYSRGEYEKVDENGVKLKSVFRFASGIRITW